MGGEYDSPAQCTAQPVKDAEVKFSPENNVHWTCIQM